MSNLVFPNTMWDTRAWLRADPTLNPLHDGRVFFRLPDNPQAPLMRIYKSGGGVQNDSETPMQDIRVALEVWGMQNSDYQKVTQLSLALESVCHQVQPGTLINPDGNTVLHNANFTTGFDSPDPDTGWPRIVCDVVLTVTAFTPTVV